MDTLEEIRTPASERTLNALFKSSNADLIKVAKEGLNAMKYVP